MYNIKNITTKGWIAVFAISAIAIWTAKKISDKIVSDIKNNVDCLEGEDKLFNTSTGNGFCVKKCEEGYEREIGGVGCVKKTDNKVSISDLSQNSFRVNVKKTEYEGYNLTVEYDDSELYGSVPVFRLDNNGDDYIYINGLKPSTVYKVSVDMLKYDEYGNYSVDKMLPVIKVKTK